MGGAGALLGGICIALVVGLLIGTLIGGIILRAACSLYNKMAGGDKITYGVPEPTFGKAMGIALVILVVQILINFTINLVVGAGAQAAGASGTAAAGFNLLGLLGSLLIGILVMSGLLTALLPTNFGRAILVTLLYQVIFIVVVIIAGALVWAVFGISFGLGGR
jgi:hypothetical protein